MWEFAEASVSQLKVKVKGVLHDFGCTPKPFSVLEGNVKCRPCFELICLKLNKRTVHVARYGRWLSQSGTPWNSRLPVMGSYLLASGERYNREGEEFSVQQVHFPASLEAFLSENALPPAKFSKPDFTQSIDPNIARMLYTRMLFSALVDADYSAAAQHFDEKYLEKTTEPPLDADQALEALECYRAGLPFEAIEKKSTR